MATIFKLKYVSAEKTEESVLIVPKHGLDGIQVYVSVEPAEEIVLIVPKNGLDGIQVIEIETRIENKRKSFVGRVLRSIWNAAKLVAAATLMLIAWAYRNGLL